MPVDRVRDCQAGWKSTQHRKEALLDRIGNEKALDGVARTELKTAVADFKAAWK